MAFTMILNGMYPVKIDIRSCLSLYASRNKLSKQL